MATLTTQLWCCRADVYPVCLDDKQMSEESTSCFLSPSALHLPFCAEQHVYFWHPTFATTTKFLLWTKINKTKSTSAPEHFGQRVHCPPRLLEFNSFITALSFIGPNGRLLWSSLLSHLSSPQCAEAFSFLYTPNSEITPYIWSTPMSLIFFTECSLPIVVAMETWLTYRLYKWDMMISKHFRVGKWNCYPPLFSKNYYFSFIL